MVSPINVGSFLANLASQKVTPPPSKRARRIDQAYWGKPRGAHTYRGARRREARGQRRSLALRDVRRMMGLSRREYDRLRYDMRWSTVAA